MTAGFPTLGEVVKYSFKATGIIPSKYEHAHSLSDKEKKNYQKALERLAAEEGISTRAFKRWAMLLFKSSLPAYKTARRYRYLLISSPTSSRYMAM